MEENFTKGPWIVNDGANSKFMRGKITTVGSEVVICDEPSQYFGLEVASANANLIACAPEMYEMLDVACSEIHHLITLVNKQILTSVNSQTETPPDLYDMESCHLIQRLLKRARG